MSNTPVTPPASPDSPARGGRNGVTPGRPPGCLNKATTVAKRAIANAADTYFASEDFARDMAALTPRERIDAMTKLATYVIPKPPAEVYVNQTIANPITHRLEALLSDS